LDERRSSAIAPSRLSFRVGDAEAEGWAATLLTLGGEHLVLGITKRLRFS
jgi:hypothetical protein